MSHANNLVTNDDLAPHLDVFRRDLSNNTTLLASVNVSGQGGGNDNSAFASVSADGRYVVFSSAASNLASHDTNGVSDVFERDVLAGVTRLLSVNAAGTGAGNAPSSAPLISDDGRWVVFESAASDLVLNDANGTNDVFVHDRITATTALVSVNALGTGSGGGRSHSPSITPDGRTVAFVSTATNLAPFATNGFAEIIVRNLAAAETRWASSNVAPHFAALTDGYRCFFPVLSADGRFVAFKAASPGTNWVLVFRHDLASGETLVLSSNSVLTTRPALSEEGRFLACENGSNVFVWDAALNSNLLVSVNLAGTGPGNGPSHTPVLAPDGQTVAFLSAATDLVTNWANGHDQLYRRDLTAGATTLVSVNQTGATSADVSSTVPILSSDGHLVAFDSIAADLVEGDSNQASDVFVRDLELGTTRLVSTADPGLASSTAAHASSVAANVHISDGFALEPASMASGAVSADGRCVVFSSYDSNLVPGDTNLWSDVFVRDLQTATTLPVSEASGGGFNTNWASSQALLSADGRFVVFSRRTNAMETFAYGVSAAMILRWDSQTGTQQVLAVEPYRERETPGRLFYVFSMSADGNRVAFQSRADASAYVPGVADPRLSRDVFLRDVSAGSNQVVSLALSGTTTGDQESFSPLVSPDGRWVLFASSSTNMATNVTGGTMSLFARDVAQGRTQLASVGADGNPQAGYSRGAVCSGNSRKAAFVATNGVILLRDLFSESSVTVCTNCDNPTLNADGTMVAFEQNADGGGPKNIVFKDLTTGASTLLSVNLAGTGGGNGPSTSPYLSADGRYVVFTSLASDLVPNDLNAAGDIFVRDLLLNTTLLASVNRFGAGSGKGHSTRPVLGADGRTVLFLSYASDLVEGDFNHQRDVFALRLPGTDTDHDGLDDEWEVAYFDNLSRDGSGDFDGDGMTDRQEFLAGTDPTARGSVLLVLKLTQLSGGTTMLLWSAVPGRTYRVQYKDTVEELSWKEFLQTVTATTTTAAFADESASAFAQRFYRVTLAP